MTASQSSDNSFIGIDVGGASFDVAWHRGDCAHYANRPDGVAALLAKLKAGPAISRRAFSSGEMTFTNQTRDISDQPLGSTDMIGPS